MKKTSKAKALKEARTELARMGGKAVVKKMGKEYFSKLGKRAMKKRWAKNKKDEKELV